MKQRPEEGDVFVISADDDRVIIGQVVAKYGKDAFYLAVFANPLPKNEVLSGYDEVLRGDVQILALTLDAKFHAGHWSVIANVPVRDDFPLPAYKEGVALADRVDVVDYTGTRRREATAAEIAVLPFRTVVAPVRVEKAARAALGLEPWTPAYSELRPRELTSQRLFE